MSRIEFTIGKPPELPPTPGNSQGWRDKIDTAARMVGSGLLHHSPGDPEVVRRKVIEAARKALSEASGVSMVASLAPSAGVPPETCLSTAGVFRMVLVAERLDWSDPTLAETVMAIIQRALDEVLGRPDRRRRPKL